MKRVFTNMSLVSDRKMWDSSWDDTVHTDYVDIEFVDDDKQHLNLNQSKSQLPIETMNEINSKIDELDIRVIQLSKVRRKLFGYFIRLN